MKLAVFDEMRLGIVSEDGASVVDVSACVPGHDTSFMTNWWTRLCAEFDERRPFLVAAAERGPRVPLSSVRLHAPVVNPSKVIGVAANYDAHVKEMLPSLTASQSASPWFLDFDIFLKAPSAIVGSGDVVRLPFLDGPEVHHEAELSVVIGREARNVARDSALDHVLGYTLLIDMTLRGDGDRSRRKSYDGFCPIGPYVVTADEMRNPHDLEITLRLGDETRQRVNTGEMTVTIPEIIAHVSSIMTLHPGDVIATGSPPGVGAVHPGDRLVATIGGIGELVVDIGRPEPAGSPQRRRR